LLVMRAGRPGALLRFAEAIKKVDSFGLIS
jgi:hypothetical protein